MRKRSGFLLIWLICAAILAVSGCGIGKPRPRLGCYPTSTPGSRFVSADRLGKHSYGYSPFEKNGITYTCKGGHIDIAHLRISADNTRYITTELYKGMLEGKRDFSFDLTADKSLHIVKLSYPKNWEQSADKEAIAKKVSLELGQYLTFSETTWHEMLTWYGYQTMAIFPEQASAFSWEDMYSNLLGIRLAAQALQDNEHGYNKALTLALDKEMKILGGKSAHFAREAAESVRSQWFEGNVFVSMEKRNLDIGLDDNYVTPMIVPQVCHGAKPMPYPVPDLDISGYGFSMDYQIRPREFEKGRILKIVYPNGDGKTIKPNIHFAKIMDDIRKTTLEKYGDESIVAYDPDKIKENNHIQIAKDAGVKKSELVKTAVIPNIAKQKYADNVTVTNNKKQEVVRAAVETKAEPSIKKQTAVKAAAKANNKKQKTVAAAVLVNSKTSVGESLKSLMSTLESQN